MRAAPCTACSKCRSWPVCAICLQDKEKSNALKLRQWHAGAQELIQCHHICGDQGRGQYDTQQVKQLAKSLETGLLCDLCRLLWLAEYESLTFSRNRMQEHRSFPSIITWVVFNEGWGQYDTQEVVQLAKSLDSSRLFDPASGWVDSEVGSYLC